MPGSSLRLSPATADLEDLLISCGQQALHADFGRGVEKPVATGDGVDVRFRRRAGDTMGRFYFQITAVGKEESCRLKDFSSLPKNFLTTSETPILPGNR